MKKYKKVIITIAFLILITIILFIILKKKDYHIDYKVDSLSINETYVKESQSYFFTINYNNENFKFIKVIAKNLPKKLIDKIEIYNNEEKNETCILPVSKKIELYPICQKDNQNISYNILNETSNFYKYGDYEKKNTTFNNLKINTLLNHNYLIWAHNGYYYLSEEEQKEILFLEKESYYNNLAYQINNYLVTPNYDEDYMFETLAIINLKNGKYEKWNLPNKISYNSYYLGNFKNNIYLFDRKNEKEFKINPKNKKMEIISKDGYGTIWDSKWKEISTTKLAANNYEFEKNDSINYFINNNNLYMTYDSYDVLITNKKVDKIVDFKNDEVFYLVGDELYLYNPKYGEVLLIKYSEWSFNNINSIFIY